MSDFREPQYAPLMEVMEHTGAQRLGLMSNYIWQTNPRRLLFTLARYKFAAKVLHGCRHVVEIGCADAFATRLVQQEVVRVTATDFDEMFLADAENNVSPLWPLQLVQHDWTSGPLFTLAGGVFDGAYALDVLEHIPPAQEHDFLHHIQQSLMPRAKLVLGMPSLESQVHASPISKAGHVNCKTGEDFRATVAAHFPHVLLFSMNDELIHTGFSPMAHYLFAVATR